MLMMMISIDVFEGLKSWTKYSNNNYNLSSSSAGTTCRRIRMSAF